jgi:hypothetical protein
MLLGPVMGTQLFALNPAFLWWACGALGVLSGVLMLLVIRSRRSTHDCAS